MNNNSRNIIINKASRKNVPRMRKYKINEH